jgi:aryl-alcohol dehydrogenase
MKAKAAILREPGTTFTIEDIDIGAPHAGELLVRIEAVGICHTDLVFASGALGTPFPLVLGHEGAGVVEQTGAGVEGFAKGDKVLLTFDSCGHCHQCKAHLPSYCDSFTALNYNAVRGDGSSPASDEDGAIAARFFGQSSFCRYAIATARNAVKLPADADLTTLAPLGCGVQTGVGGITRSLGARAGSSLVILGGGAVGLSAVMGGVIAGCRTIIVIEPRPERRMLALELGAHHPLDPKDGDMVEAVRTIEPSGVDYVFDTSGVTTIVQSSFGMLAPNGMVGLVGVPGDLEATLSLPVVPTITYGHGVKGIIEGDSEPAEFLPELVRLHTEGRLPVEKMIKTYPFERINDAIADSHSGQCIKPVLVLGDALTGNG